jgi:hypothetical protein
MISLNIGIKKALFLFTTVSAKPFKKGILLTPYKIN